MISMFIFATSMLGFIGTFVQSRRVTEASVLNAAATSLVYGVIEQMKGLDYNTLLPSTDVDDAAPEDIRDNPPYIRIRINQSLTVWLRAVYTRAKDADPTPKAPLATPAPDATADSVHAIDNAIQHLPLSTATGTKSQDLALNLWVWVDEIPDTARDVSEVKRITVVYTYSYMDGITQRVIRDREVFVRTRFDQ
jgi:hypothetical protein